MSRPFSPRPPDRARRAPRRLAALAPLTLVAALVADAAPPGGPRPAAAPAAGRIDAARVAAADAEPGSWLVHGRTFDEQRFSPLDQIDRSNVSELSLAWSYETGTTRGLEATPIVVDGVLYATGNWGVVFALDAASGRELWRFDPQVPGAKGRDACCDVVNRGVAVWKGRVYVAALDGRLIALDAATGARLWEVQTTDPKRPYTVTMAPRIVKDRVILGNSGAELGVRGYFSAYDPRDGTLLWRFYTVPASKHGPHEHPELAQAAATWPEDALWESGLGGTVWDAIAYDPELDLLYVGVGNASVYDRNQRSPGGGDNLFVSSILAVRPETGRLQWHYQTTPGDHWDYTATQHLMLADLPLAAGGATRRVLMQAPKNGFFYVLDAATGELLSADPYVDVSWASHVDPASGRPVERPEAHWSEAPAIVTPSVVGGHNWHPMSFSPRTGWVYIPTISAGYRFVPDPDFRYTPGRFNTGEDWPALMAESEGFEDALRWCNPTHITAWDPVARRQVWRVNHDTELPGGLLATAGDLLFQGRPEGRLVAYDARSGAALWEAKTGVGIMAPPVAYLAGGEQYVAVLAGIGGSQALQLANLGIENHGRLLAFKRGGNAPLPPPAQRPPGTVHAPPLALEPARVARGRDLYATHCMRCHGPGAKSNGVMPDLRHASAEVHARWEAIVLGGVRQARGMASFADQLDVEDTRAIHAYVVERATHEPALFERLAAWFGRHACVPLSLAVD